MRGTGGKRPGGGGGEGGEGGGGGAGGEGGGGGAGGDGCDDDDGPALFATTPVIKTDRMHGATERTIYRRLFGQCPRIDKV
jgi:hypothetical protein